MILHIVENMLIHWRSLEVILPKENPRERAEMNIVSQISRYFA